MRFILILLIFVNIFLVSCNNISKYSQTKNFTKLDKWVVDSDDKVYQCTIFIMGTGVNISIVLKETMNYGQNELTGWVSDFTTDALKKNLEQWYIFSTDIIDNVTNYCLKGIEIRQEIDYLKENGEYSVLMQYTIKKSVIYKAIADEMNKSPDVFNDSTINFFTKQADMMQDEEIKTYSSIKPEKELVVKENINSNELENEIIPIKPVKYVRVTSEFGRRNGRNHDGIDLSAGADTPIFAVLPGVVITSGYHRAHGNLIVIQHDNDVQTAYSHNKQNFVQIGEEIHQGQMIGTVGNTGRTTGNHLHFEYRIKGIPKNPRLLIPDF